MKYERPRMEITFVEEEDVLTTSQGLNSFESGSGGELDYWGSSN